MKKRNNYIPRRLGYINLFVYHLYGFKSKKMAGDRTPPAIYALRVLFRLILDVTFIAQTSLVFAEIVNNIPAVVARQLFCWS